MKTYEEFGGRLEALTMSLEPYAFRLTKDKDYARDLLRETVYKAFSNRDKFTEGTNLKAWMYTIMRNTFITNYQRISRRKTFIDSTDSLHYINSSVNVTSQNQALNNFVHNDIQEAVSRLKNLYKVPFLMYFQGYKYQEIAEQLDIPIGTVKNRIHIARKELKNILNIYAN